MEKIPLFLWNLEVWKVSDVLDDLVGVDVLERLEVLDKRLEVLDDLVALENTYKIILPTYDTAYLKRCDYTSQDRAARESFA